MTQSRHDPKLDGFRNHDQAAQIGDPIERLVASAFGAKQAPTIPRLLL
jgi:hypothetical protein